MSLYKYLGELAMERNQCLSIDEYMTWQANYMATVERGVFRLVVVMVIAIALGVWAVALDSWVWAVLAFLVAGTSYAKILLSLVIVEQLESQKMLARLINGQRQELTEMRKVLTEADRFLKDAG